LAERQLLVSSTKTTALALDALIREIPEHALIPKLARGVLDARKRGRWGSTQDNLAVIGAMRRYFDTYEKVTPSYTGKLWFGKDAYLEQVFAGRSSARATAHLDWTALAPGSSHDVALAKDGTGRMYYRLGITYAPKQTDLPALDAGFLVRRTYTAVDDPADVTKLPDGRLKLRLGARVLVQVEAITTAKRDAVAIVDPLPAGLEAVNDQLATSERAVTTTADTRWDYRAMRDNRSEAFAMHLSEGTHTFAYTARAATPGTFPRRTGEGRGDVQPRDVRSLDRPGGRDRIMACAGIRFVLRRLRKHAAWPVSPRVSTSDQLIFGNGAAGGELAPRSVIGGNHSRRRPLSRV